MNKGKRRREITTINNEQCEKKKGITTVAINENEQRK